MTAWGYGGYGGYSDHYSSGAFGGYDEDDSGHYDGYNDFYGYGSYDNYDAYAGQYDTSGNYGNPLTEENVRRVNSMGRAEWDHVNGKWDRGLIRGDMMGIVGRMASGIGR